MSLYFWNGSLLFRDLGSGPQLAKGPDCCCVEGACCCDELPDTWYVQVIFRNTTLGGGTEVRTDYFEFTRMTATDACGCGGGSFVEGCDNKAWHGTFTAAYDVFGVGLVWCDTHIVMRCSQSDPSKLDFDFWINGPLNPGVDCESFAPSCNDCSTASMDCPVTQVDVGSGTTSFIDCEPIYQLHMRTDPWS